MSGMSQPPTLILAPYGWSLILSFATLLLSIVLLYIARFSARLEFKDVGSLRSMFDSFTEWGKRARWAQQNRFEAFTIHAPASLLAVVAVLSGHALPAISVVVAWAHPVLRVAYIFAYLFNVPIARSVAWFLGLLCSGILYGVGLGALM